MDNKRLLLALVLTMGILWGWSVLFPPPRPSPAPEAATPEAAATATPSAPVAEGRPVPEAEHVPATAGLAPRTIQVTTPLFRMSLSSAGGTIQSWTLSRYAAAAVLPGKVSPPVELVSPAAAEGTYAPLGLATGDLEVDARLAGAVFAVDREELTLGEAELGSITLAWSDGEGTSVRKTLEFDGSTYAIGLKLEARVRGQERVYLLLGPHLADALDVETRGAYTDRVKVLEADGGVFRRTRQEVPLDKVREATGGRWPVPGRNWIDLLDAAGALTRRSAVGWAAVEQNYFAGAVFAERPLEEVVVLPVLQDLETPPALTVGVRVGETIDLHLLGAPKDSRVLTAVRPDLVHLIDFGYFSAIARALLFGLQFLYRFVGNYGLAIVLLTVVIKLLFLPLSIKQLDAMQKMAKLRPQMKQIEDRHKRALADPKQRLEASRKKQAEMMELYKREGVNPASGCLPLLLQLPVLWGFYNLLGTAIELRHAPFVLWIQDLSAKDPFYVTPILMVISQLVMQAVTPAIGDPMQRRMMFIMPVMFGYFFKDLASGLTLYWLTQNVLSVIQQVWLNGLTRRREEREKEARRHGKSKVDRKNLEEA